MTFPTKLARALVPAAVIVLAAPAAAADSADMARLKAHIGGVHTMTANFVQTDSRGPVRCGQDGPRASRQGPVPIWQRRPAAGRQRQDPDAGRLPGRPEVQLAAQSHAARGAAVELARSQGTRTDRPERQFERRIGQGARPLPVRLADFSCSCAAALRQAGSSSTGWTAIDGQNRRTTVKLSDVRYNVSVPASAFTYADPKKK